MKTLAYIFGPPGAGKTTLMDAICEGYSLLYTADKPIKHRAMCSASSPQPFSVLGADAKPFGGTDTLSYTAVAEAPSWLKSLASCKAGSLVFAEGDRLANARFFDEARRHYRLKLFYLSCQDDISMKRRSDRAQKNGLKMQSQSWVQGRITKHRNLASSQHGVEVLDATMNAGDLAVFVWSKVREPE